MFDVQALIGWLIAQPTFIQVGASLLFFILVAPAVLAAVALTTERIEKLIGRAADNFVPRPSERHVAGSQRVPPRDTRHEETA